MLPDNYVLAYVPETEWLDRAEAEDLALRRDEWAKEQFLADIFPEDYRPELDDLYDPRCYGL